MNRTAPEGATVKVKHFRLVRDSHADAEPQLKSPYEIKQAGLTPESKGGRTEVTVILEDGREATGVAEVSLKDNYCRAIGRAIATGRALKELEVF